MPIPGRKVDKKGRPGEGRIPASPTLPGILPAGPPALGSGGGVGIPPMGPPQTGTGALPGILPVGQPQLGPTGIPGVPAAPQNSGALQSILGLLGLQGGGGIMPGPSPMPGLQTNPVLQLIQAMKNRRYPGGRI